jgi:hypothetical protein
MVVRRNGPTLAPVIPNATPPRTVAYSVTNAQHIPQASEAAKTNNIAVKGYPISPAPAVSKAVVELLNSRYKHYPPSKKLLKQLTEMDKPELIQEFREQPLTNKIHSLWALAYLGGDDVREEIKKVLEDDYTARPLNISDEMPAMLSIAKGMGYLSKEDSIAYDYLLDHIRPENWIGLRKWTVEDTQSDLNGMLAGVMVTCIGLSGRDHARQALDDIMQWDQKSLDEMVSAIVEANFYLSKSRVVDRKELVLSSTMIEWLLQDYEKWIKTDEGQKWNNWYRMRKNLK